MNEGLSRGGPKLRPFVTNTVVCCIARAAREERSSSKARRARSSTSISAPIRRHLVQHHGGRRLHRLRRSAAPHGPRRRRDEGLHHPRRRRAAADREREISDMLHGMGREFGATTGRARRCGWFDAVATRYAPMVNGIDELAITNLDGLDTSRRSGSASPTQVRRETPGTSRLPIPAQLENCKPDLYRDRRGGKPSTAGEKSWTTLPAESENLSYTPSPSLTGATCGSSASARTGTDHRPLRKPCLEPSNPFRATSPSSWMATAAGRRKGPAPHPRPRGRRGIGARVPSQAAASCRSSTSPSTPFPPRIGSGPRPKWSR